LRLRIKNLPRTMVSHIRKLVLLALCFVDDLHSLSPVVIVPGAAGSVMEAKLVGKMSVPRWYCYRTTSDWFRLWLDISSLLPLQLDCWCDNVRLEWDMKTLTASNPQGVLTRSPGWGTTEGIEQLDTYGFVKYFKPLIDYLVDLGYTKGKDIRGAPYDFRYSPDTIPDNYHPRLKSLIEDTYRINGNKSVTIVSHSYGCPVTLYFLTHVVTEQWKRKHIKQWMPLSGLYAGTTQELEVLLSGYLEGIPNVVVNRAKIRAQQRTNLVNLFMLPTDAAFNLSQPLVKTAKRSYNLKQLEQLLIDAGLSDAVKMRKNVISSKSLLSKPPHVKIVCVYGNTPDSTPEYFTYGEGEFPDTTPQVVHGAGDGTVNLSSLKLCGKFKEMQNESVTAHEIPNTDHNGVIGHETTFGLLKAVL